MKCKTRSVGAGTITPFGESPLQGLNVVQLSNLTVVGQMRENCSKSYLAARKTRALILPAVRRNEITCG
jgi:hypothetical protein